MNVKFQLISNYVRNNNHIDALEHFIHHVTRFDIPRKENNNNKLKHKHIHHTSFVAISAQVKEITHVERTKERERETKKDFGVCSMFRT